MKTNRILPLAVGVLALGLVSISRAEEASTSKVDLKTKLEELRGLPPEERRVKLREFTQSLTPEQRRELQKLRENAGNRSAVSPEQRAALQKRAEARLVALEKKKADGSITEQETKQLEQLKKRLEAAKAKGAAKPAAPEKDKAAANKEENAKP